MAKDVAETILYSCKNGHTLTGVHLNSPRFVVCLTCASPFIEFKLVTNLL